MCRICGRMVKCVFDSMPSRVHQTSSQRAFTTIRQVSPQMSRSPAPSLSQAFSRCTLSTPSLTRTRPTIFPATTAVITAQPSIPRTFSTTAAVLGKRRRMDTFSPSRRVQKRRHGYLARLRTRSGREILKRRALKKKGNLSW